MRIATSIFGFLGLLLRINSRAKLSLIEVEYIKKILK